MTVLAKANEPDALPVLLSRAPNEATRTGGRTSGELGERKRAQRTRRRFQANLESRPQAGNGAARKSLEAVPGTSSGRSNPRRQRRGATRSLTDNLESPGEAQRTVGRIGEGQRRGNPAQLIRTPVRASGRGQTQWRKPRRNP